MGAFLTPAPAASSFLTGIVPTTPQALSTAPASGCGSVNQALACPDLCCHGDLLQSNLLWALEPSIQVCVPLNSSF